MNGSNPTPTPAALADAVSAFLDCYFPLAGSASLVFDQGDSLPPISIVVRGDGLPINCGDNDPWPVSLRDLPAINDPKRKLTKAK